VHDQVSAKVSYFLKTFLFPEKPPPAYYNNTPAIRAESAGSLLMSAPDTVKMETGQISGSILRTGCVFSWDLPGYRVATFVE